MAKELTADEREVLRAWVEELRARFDAQWPEVPLDELLVLAGSVAAGVARPAVPVTAYVAGYLAALHAQQPVGRDAAEVVQDVIDAVPAPDAGGA